MRMKILTAGMMAALGASMAASGAMSKAPVPPEPASASAVENAAMQPSPVPNSLSSARSAMSEVDTSRSASETQLVTVSREIARGETLDWVLAEAGLAVSDRHETALALGAEYDLRRLRPGDLVITSVTPDGAPRHVILKFEDGVRIEAFFDGRNRIATRIVEPDQEQFSVAGEARIDSSIFAALDEAGLPVRFATDLAQVLGGTVDFRRDLSGGEILRLIWRETRVGNEIVGQPEITFAALDLGDALYEVVWPEDASGRAAIFRDGEVMLTFAQPVEGARLSSVFGRRRHPIYGNVRVHTGVDFAAARGAPVRATAPGRISFIGRRGGFGRVVEIAHGANIMTRYAHLSATAEGISIGARVAAGDVIGNVGATGTATGPNLHYEVRVNGRPTDPLLDDRLASVTETEAQQTLLIGQLKDARVRLEERLTKNAFGGPL